jgi:hypothetical protein
MGRQAFPLAVILSLATSISTVAGQSYQPQSDGKSKASVTTSAPRNDVQESLATDSLRGSGYLLAGGRCTQLQR